VLGFVKLSFDYCLLAIAPFIMIKANAAIKKNGMFMQEMQFD
jgi:hypothetical protein